MHTVERTLLKVIPKRISELPQCPKKPFCRWGLVLGSSPFPAWTCIPLHGLWHQGADTVSASLTLCDSNPQLLERTRFVFLKTFLSGHFASMYHGPDQLTVRVLCICTSAQCKFVNNSFFFLLIFFQNKVLCRLKNRELVTNIEHCSFFTETNCTRRCFSCFVVRF